MSLLRVIVYCSWQDKRVVQVFVIKEVVEIILEFNFAASYWRGQDWPVNKYK